MKSLKYLNQPSVLAYKSLGEKEVTNWHRFECSRRERLNREAHHKMLNLI